MQLNIEEIDIFKTSIQQCKLNLNIDLITTDAYSLKSNIPSEKKSNTNGYQSPNIEKSIIDSYNLTGITQVVSFLDSLSMFYTQKFELTNKEVVLSNLWLNINHKNSSNDIHTHPGAFLSGIIYIKNSETAETCFVNNDVSQPHHFATHLQEDIYKFPLLNSMFSYKPEDNSMVIFSGVQHHFVKNNLTDKDRITIAFNLIIQDKK